MTLLKTLKDRAKESASRLAGTPTGQRLLGNPDVQRAVSWAAQTSTAVRENFTEAKKTLSQLLALETEDDLRHLKRRIDKLEREKK